MHTGLHRPASVLVARNADDLGLAQMEVFLQLQSVLHAGAVLPAVDLGAQGMDGRTLAAVEHAALQKAFVGRAAHFAAEGVNLPDEMALCRPADGRVAGAIAHRVHIDGEDGRLTAEARRRQSGLNARVPRADDDDVVISRVITQSDSSNGWTRFSRP